MREEVLPFHNGSTLLGVKEDLPTVLFLVVYIFDKFFVKSSFSIKIPIL